MRGRLLKDPVALADYEILEMLLFLGIPRRDTKPLAKGLIMRFGGFAKALMAGAKPLDEAGVPPRGAEAFKMIADAAEQLTKAEHRDPVMLGDHVALARYLADGARPWRQGWSMVLLGTRNQVVAERACDAADAAAVAGQVLREALRRHATAVILVRGSAGPPEVTEADCALFQTVQERAEALSVTLYDLVVIGEDRRWCSLTGGV
ncbi:MAG: JAB domain-containing protein [Janthinobacterium lividum]